MNCNNNDNKTKYVTGVTLISEIFNYEYLDPAVVRDQPQMKMETIVAMTIETIVARGSSLTTKKIEITARKINAIIAMKTIIIVTVITRKASPA